MCILYLCMHVTCVLCNVFCVVRMHVLSVCMYDSLWCVLLLTQVMCVCNVFTLCMYIIFLFCYVCMDALRVYMCVLLCIYVFVVCL